MTWNKKRITWAIIIICIMLIGLIFVPPSMYQKGLGIFALIWIFSFPFLIKDFIKDQKRKIALMHEDDSKTEQSIPCETDGLVSESEFKQFVADAIDALPEEFFHHMASVNISVQDYASDEQMDDVKLWGGRPGLIKDDLFGIYGGVALKDRRTFGTYFPSIIVIFKRPIEKRCTTKDQVRNAVKHVVEHEVGHHFGLNDARMYTIDHMPVP